MAEKSRDPFWRRNNPIMWGVLATAAVVLFGTWAASQSVCQMDFWGNQSCSGSKWSVFLKAAPNEVGDTLAGFAGALAFVWLIATVWLQGQELAEQREELREQRIATQDMARALAAQANIFEDEQRQRDERRVAELFEQKLRGLLQLATERKVTAAFPSNSHGVFFGNIDTSGNEVLFCHSFAKISRSFATDRAYLGADKLADPTSLLLESFNEISNLVESIVELEAQLDAAQRQRYTNLRISEISDNVFLAKDILAGVIAKQDTDREAAQ